MIVVRDKMTGWSLQVPLFARLAFSNRRRGRALIMKTFFMLHNTL
jgi:hypothetical protein